jgi:thiamine-monophosphate kinase
LKPISHERGLVEFLRSRRNPSAAGGGLRLGIGDDTAVFRPKAGFESLLTCDLLVEDVHFTLESTSPWELGAKSVGASLSDIASMGGLPRAYLVSLAIPKRKRLPRSFFKSLYDGMQAWAGAFGASLAGGDTSASSGPLLIDVMMLGEVEQGRAILRSGARPGDLVFCSGTLGDSAAGLALLQGEISRKRLSPAASLQLIKRHRLPNPRCLAGRFLLEKRLASSCIDISDGLSSELHHLAKESAVAIDIEAESIPMSAPARSLSRKSLDWALSGGEDYELLFTAPPSKLAFLEKNFSRVADCRLSCIGRVKKGSGVRIHKDGRWKTLRDSGYEHTIA